MQKMNGDWCRELYEKEENKKEIILKMSTGIYLKK